MTDDTGLGSDPDTGPDPSPEDATGYAGPPEPVATPDGLAVVQPSEDGTRLDTHPVAEVVCQRCGLPQEATLDDEELHPPAECVGCERQGPFAHPVLDDEQVAVAARAAAVWDLPTQAHAQAYGDLWADLRAFIRDHWDTDDATLYDALTAYALSTWFRPNLQFLPHLMTMGKTTGGKTRLLNTLARVSYRGMVSASATPSSLFRLIDAYDVTYYVSEYHGLSPDARRELDNVVRGGQKRGEKVTRTEQSSIGYVPRVYNPFAHVGIASQEEPADDIVNRCLRVHSAPAGRSMPPTLDDRRATALRDRLLYARFHHLGGAVWPDAESAAYAVLAERDIEGRSREKLVPLLTVAALWGRLDDGTMDDVIELVEEQDRAARLDSEEAVFVQAVCDLADEAVANVTGTPGGDDARYGDLKLPYDPIIDRVETLSGEEKSSQWVGNVRRRLGFTKTRTNAGMTLSDPDLAPKLREQCEQLGIDWDPAGRDPAPRLPPEDTDTGPCGECGRDRRLSHRAVFDGGHRLCAECADDLRAYHAEAAGDEDESEDENGDAETGDGPDNATGRPPGPDGFTDLSGGY